MSNGPPIAQPSLTPTARPFPSPSKPFSWRNPGVAAATATVQLHVSDDADGVNSPPPLTDVASWPDMSAAAGAGARGRASSSATASKPPPPAASGSGQGAPPAQSPASRASSRTKKQKWVQIAPSELQAAADAARSNANGARRAQRAGSQQQPPPPLPVPPLPASSTPIDDVFVVRPREQAQASNSASSVSGRTNTSTTSSTSPSSSHASLGPAPPSFQSQHVRQTPSLSSSHHMSASGSDPQDAQHSNAKRVAPSQAGAVSVSGYKDLDSLSGAHGRVVLFGSIDALPDACQPHPSVLSPHPAHSDTQSQSEHGAPAQTSPQDPLSPPNQPAIGPPSDTNPVPAFTSLSISPQLPYDPSPAALQHPWYVHPQQDAWQLPAAAWQHANGSIPELTAPLSEEPGEPRPLSEADRPWSGSSWTGQHAQFLQTPQLGSHYPEATNSPVHSPYYYQVPPRHAHQYHASSHHWPGEYTSPVPHDTWEDRPPRERRARETERDNIFEVDYSRMYSDRRPRDRDRNTERERERDNAGTPREKDAGAGSGPRPRRSSTADRGFYSGARRGRSHSQPLDGGSSRGRGGYRGGYHRHERAHAASSRGLSPETYWTSAVGSARPHGPRQQSHPGELPLPVPHTVIPAGVEMDPTRYFVLGQIEYYFGPRNLATDFWLRQQMDSRGWIPIALVATFNRVRALTASPALVREVMGVSALLEVRGDRVRLRDAQWKPYVTPDAVPSAGDSSDDEDARVEAALRRPATGDGDEEDSDDDIVFVLSVDESPSSLLQAPAP
ncbi:hypothetical protein AURDEDRAFT_110265 [Auricularia subglabra TFB-10046 SS5]|nr:hypothetical protein AURDEDRAFT_110265 [Auricularia subglabra TFB-10046 SS5]